MPDFLISPCTQPNGNCKIAGIVCKSITSNQCFGICDDPPPLKKPAYIQFNRDDEWIAKVNNLEGKEVCFKAIDNCVPVLRSNGDLECRCDGFLIYDDNIIFIELKDRNHKGWLVKGREQITITIDMFLQNHNRNDYKFSVAYVCNKQRPMATTGISNEVQKFKDDTANLLNNNGLLLKVERVINI